MFRFVILFITINKVLEIQAWVPMEPPLFVTDVLILVLEFEFKNYLTDFVKI